MQHFTDASLRTDRDRRQAWGWGVTELLFNTKLKLGSTVGPANGSDDHSRCLTPTLLPRTNLIAAFFTKN